MDNNTRIETQPAVKVETSFIPEAQAEAGIVETPPVVASTAVSPQVEAIVESVEETTGLEVGADAPKTSAGFPIESKSTGASRIVLEKLIGAVANL